MVNEKRLYDLLIMVYRSPELMIKMTGTKQEHLKPKLEGPETNVPEVTTGKVPELAFDTKEKND